VVQVAVVVEVPTLAGWAQGERDLIDAHKVGT